LYDIGVVSTKEPFSRLVHQGMILGQLEYTLYRNNQEEPVSAHNVASDGTHKVTGEKLIMEKISEDDVRKEGEGFVWKEDGSIAVDAKAFKMSKSRGNVVNPDDIIHRYGADSLRLYEMFMGPLKDMKSWSMHGVDGVFRFLNRVWRLMIEEDTDRIVSVVKEMEPHKEHLKQLHLAIKKVTQDIVQMQFNTAIAAMMVFVNEANKWEERPRSVLNTFLILLNPFAPHIAEELWQRLGNDQSISFESWPEFNEEFLKEDTKEIVIQINGKLRGSVDIPSERINDKVYLEKEALASQKIQNRLSGLQVRKVIVVPGKLINIVAN
jgi:leucyl-tRNA synthetase